MSRKVFSDFVLILFLALLPTQLGKHFFADFSYIRGIRIDYLAPSIYLTDLFFLVLVLFYLKDLKKEFLKHKKILSFVLFLLLINIFSSTHLLLSFYKLIRYAQVCILFVIFKNSTISTMKIFVSFIAGTIFTLTLALLQFVSKSSLQGIFYYFGERSMNLSTPSIAKAAIEGVEFLRPYATFSHPNSMAGFFLLFFLFFLINPLRIKNFWLRCLGIYSSVFIIFLSFSKIAAATAIFLGTLWLLKQNKKNCFLCAFSKTVLLAVFFSTVFFASTDIYTAEKRIVLLRQSVTIFSQYWTTGTGLGHYVIYQQNLPNPFPPFFAQPVHNIIILFLAETGLIIGSIIYILLCKFVLIHKQNIFFMFVFSAVMLTGFFDHYWLTLHQNLLIAGVFAGLAFRKKRALSQ